jgi:hypothetical protein
MNNGPERSGRRWLSFWSVESIIFSVLISLLVLILGVALGKMQIWIVIVSSLVVLCSAVTGSFLTARTFLQIPSNVHDMELMRAIKAELSHITRALPSYLLTEEQYSRIESSQTTRAVIICMHEMGLEFDPDPEVREVLTVSYNDIVTNNVARGVTYHWIAPRTHMNQVRTDIINDLFGPSVRTTLLKLADWQLLPFSFETVFILTENLGRRHIDCFVQIPIPTVGAARYWIKIEPNQRDQWFGVARPYLDESLLRLRRIDP